MRFPEKKKIVENIFKVVIFNILFAIAWKTERPEFYAVYFILNVFIILIFSFLDSNVEEDETIHFKRKRSFEEYIRKKKGHHSIWHKTIDFFFASPPKFMVYSYIIIFSIIFFIFNEEYARYGEVVIGTFLSWLFDFN